MNHKHSQPPKPIVSLEKGQTWLMKTERIVVKRVGKYLVEFTLIKQPPNGEPVRRTRAASQLHRVQDVIQFLQNRNAVLEVEPVRC